MRRGPGDRQPGEGAMDAGVGLREGARVIEDARRGGGLALAALDDDRCRPAPQPQERTLDAFLQTEHDGEPDVPGEAAARERVGDHAEAPPIGGGAVEVDEDHLAATSARGVPLRLDDAEQRAELRLVRGVLLRTPGAQRPQGVRGPHPVEVLPLVPDAAAERGQVARQPDDPAGRGRVLQRFEESAHGTDTAGLVAVKACREDHQGPSRPSSLIPISRVNPSRSGCPQRAAASRLGPGRGSSSRDDRPAPRPHRAHPGSCFTVVDLTHRAPSLIVSSRSFPMRR